MDIWVELVRTKHSNCIIVDNAYNRLKALLRSVEDDQDPALAVKNMECDDAPLERVAEAVGPPCKWERSAGYLAGMPVANLDLRLGGPDQLSQTHDIKPHTQK